MPAPLLSPRSYSETSSLLPLFIFLGIFGTLALGWFALSSCMGDDLRRSLGRKAADLIDRLRPGSSRRRRGADSGRYGRMGDDDLEAHAFDVSYDEDLYANSNPARDAAYDDDDDDAGRRYEARQSNRDYGY